MDRNNLLLHEIKEIIEFLGSQIQDLKQKESDDLRQEPKDKKIEVDLRMKETMQATLVKQFQTILAQTEKAQTDFSKAVERKIVKQVRISE